MVRLFGTQCAGSAAKFNLGACLPNSNQEIGNSFTRFYYDQFDADRNSLRPLYRNNSMMSFEGEQFMGADAILLKLTGLPFTRVQHKVIKCDCQPTTAVSPPGIMVSVSGNLIIDGGQPMKFAQSFLLLPDAQNPASYWVHNDIFRLNLG